MGAAAGSLEGNSAEEQVQFWKIWNESSQDERHRIGVGISRKINALMRSDEIRSAEQFKRELAKHVKTIIPRSRRRRPPRKRQ
jgi:hypothetical protein